MLTTSQIPCVNSYKDKNFKTCKFRLLNEDKDQQFSNRHRDRQFVFLGRTLSCGDGASHKLDEQSLQDASASLQKYQNTSLFPDER